MYTILVVNLGGTSTKLSIYQDEELVASHTLNHSEEEMAQTPLAGAQLDYRKQLTLEWIAKTNRTMDDFDAIAVRGATVKIAKRSGTYLVEGVYKEALLELFVPDKPLVHGIRVVTPLAIALVENREIPIFITDPPSVNELQDVARLSGLKDYERRARFHALNHKMVARIHAKKIGKPYETCRFIVAHLGGGISIGAHENGHVIDVSDAGDGYGPFSTDRAGTVATEAMLDMCYTRELSQSEVYAKIRGGGGLMSHLGTQDLRIVEAQVRSGNKNSELIFQTLGYQIAKEIGTYFACLKGEADAILLAGGLAHSENLVALIKSYVSKFAPVFVYAGEFENEALAAGAYRVLTGQEKPILIENN